jgi:hypothetical protein
MDDIDERIAFARLVEPLLEVLPARGTGRRDVLEALPARGTGRRDVLEALWQERAALGAWLLLRAPCGAPGPGRGRVGDEDARAARAH